MHSDTTISAQRLIPDGQQHVCLIQQLRRPYQFREHDHDGYCEWMLVLRGRLQHRANGVVQDLEVGDLVFVPERMRHSLAAEPGLSFANTPIRLDFHSKELGDGELQIDLLTIDLIDRLDDGHRYYFVLVCVRPLGLDYYK